ncbi:MAG TPA: hypothetical protein VL405_07450 [Sphingomonas sp.]|jgi:hypothetical protein|nr:hypothetical protein [Sphingomonas sp.]
MSVTGILLRQVDTMIDQAITSNERPMLLQVPSGQRMALDQAIGALPHPELRVDAPGDRQFRYRHCWVVEAAPDQPAILLVCESGKAFS